ncbi:hypothetical protein RIVM261_080030 [Rivularia sp. IAM M-261]|nr:hypothetical protein RIVM261_080030 [Rivularia sp. IAM M-261]
MQQQNYKEHFINNIDAAINKGIELSAYDSLDVIIYEGSRKLLQVAKAKGYNWQCAGGYPFIHPVSNQMVNYTHLVFDTPTSTDLLEFTIIVNWTD